MTKLKITYDDGSYTLVWISYDFGQPKLQVYTSGSAIGKRVKEIKSEGD